MTADQPTPQPSNSRSFLVTYRGTLIACAAVALLTSQKYAGFMLMFILLVFFVWLIYSMIVAAVKPMRRRPQLTRVALWLATILLIGGIHGYRHVALRVDADRVAANVAHTRSGMDPGPPILSRLVKTAKI